LISKEISVRSSPAFADMRFCPPNRCDSDFPLERSVFVNKKALTRLKASFNAYTEFHADF